MKKAIVRGLLAMTLCACGGTADPVPLTDAASNDAVPSDTTTSNAVLIDSVKLPNGEELTFFDATTADDESPAIIVSRLGDNSKPEFELELYQRAHYTITPAELWREATGDDQIPDELLENHIAQTLADGRPNADLQHFDAETEKAFFPSVSQMFPLDSNSTGLVPPSGCWSNGGIKVVEVGPGAASNAYSMCASNGNGVRAFSIDAGCDPVLNTNTTVRVASFNGGIQSFQSKWCWASNNDQMSCIAYVTLNPNFFHGASFYKNGTKHRLGIGLLASSLTETFKHSSYYLASATLNPTGIKRFEDTGCTAFTENFRRP